MTQKLKIYLSFLTETIDSRSGHLSVKILLEVKESLQGR